VCNFRVPTCDLCPTSYCMKDVTRASSRNSGGGSSGPSTGAIAGGVIGGVAAIAILTYLVWRFCIRNRRSEIEQEQWSSEPEQTKEINDFSSRRSQRASTHTVNSIASTVLTRASNIIQIAYIPGVTNRATPTSPNILVPPVPPIPLEHSDHSSQRSQYEDQHFFVPGDLRNSTYSGVSNYSDRTSYARTSYAPRSSVASTIYGKNAVVSPLPAQKGNFLKPSLVSVKSKGASSTSGETTPPVPSIDLEKYDKPPPSPVFSIGSTFFKNASASTATAVRPQVVRVGSNSPRQVEVKSKPSSLSSTVAASDIGKDQSPKTATSGQDDLDEGPFSDPPKSAPNSSESTLSEIAEETSRTEKPSSSSVRDSSPFSDQHALREQ
jgi:hypothetical protein